MKKIIILLMAVSIILTSCGKSAGLLNSDKKTGNKTPATNTNTSNQLQKIDNNIKQPLTNYVKDNISVIAPIVIIVAIVVGSVVWIINKNNNKPLQAPETTEPLQAPETTEPLQAPETTEPPQAPETTEPPQAPQSDKPFMRTLYNPKRKKPSKKLKSLPVLSNSFLIDFSLIDLFSVVPRSGNYNIKWDTISAEDLTYLYTFDKTHVNWLPHIRNRLEELCYDVSTLKR